MFPANTKILVVDDMGTVRKMYIRILKELGFSDITEAANGVAGWDTLNSASQLFELVISDWNMPQATGLDLLKRVRADQRYKTLPFILVTAEAEQKTVTDAIAAGVTAYLVKPVAPDLLKSKLAAVYKELHGG